ncbi:MAG: hypothetical protein HQK77_05250 [Desulfobacterales bacterium]|nr:hypothetical protein [Desulfobacterales bacterium]
MKPNPKLVAAITAVVSYIESEQAVMVDTYVKDEPNAIQRDTSFQVWALSGRQTHMHMRSIMQMKGLHGVKFRNS